MTEKFEVAGYGELEELIDAQCASIDWLTVTAKDEEHQRLLLSEAQRLFSASKAAGNVQRPWKFSGYDGWSIQGVRYGQRSDSTILMLSGHAASLNWEPALSFCDNITRIDLALTVTLAEPWPGIAKTAYEFIVGPGKTDNRFTRKFSLVVNSEGGETLYIGSRASDQFGRLYDKGREQGEALNLPAGKIWRYEVEFKSYRASKVGSQLLERSKQCNGLVVNAMADTVYLWFMARGILPISHKSDEVPFALDVSAKVTDDEVTLSWLSTSVSPAVRRLFQNGKKRETLLALGLLSVD